MSRAAAATFTTLTGFLESLGLYVNQDGTVVDGLDSRLVEIIIGEFGSKVIEGERVLFIESAIVEVAG